MAGRKVFLRFAQASDVERLIKDGVITGPPPARETWNQRLVKWLSEQRAGRRVILIAEDHSGLLGMVQLVFRLPLGYDDPEAANGMDVAMMEGLRLREGTQTNVGTELVGEVQRVAVKRNIKTLTFLLPMTNNRAIAQARSWGFEEFRIMAEPNKMLAFFRKSVD
ncbi:MAG: GNAT family N-acetyltransferase [Vulcanimicrobiaceae bacterium]